MRHLRSVSVTGADELADIRPHAVPFGRFIERMSLLQATPNGGGVATLEGAGFREGMDVMFGQKAAEIKEIVSPENEADLTWLRKALPVAAEQGAVGGWSGRTIAAAAFAYDVAAPALAPETAGDVQRYLMSAIDHYKKADERNAWFPTNISSTNPQANLGAISAALVMGDIHPDSDSVLHAAKRNLLRYIEGSFGPDGGAIEGMGRGMEGLTDYIHAPHLLARREDRTLLDHQRIDAVPELIPLLTPAPDRKPPEGTAVRTETPLFSTASLMTKSGTRPSPSARLSRSKPGTWDASPSIQPRHGLPGTTSTSMPASVASNRTSKPLRAASWVPLSLLKAKIVSIFIWTPDS